MGVQGERATWPDGYKKIEEEKLKFNILYTNADSFLNKRQELSSLIDTMSKKPDVIIITEVKSKFKSAITESELGIKTIIYSAMILQIKIIGA